MKIKALPRAGGYRAHILADKLGVSTDEAQAFKAGEIIEVDNGDVVNGLAATGILEILNQTAPVADNGDD